MYMHWKVGTQCLSKEFPYHPKKENRWPPKTCSTGWTQLQSNWTKWITMLPWSKQSRSLKNWFIKWFHQLPLPPPKKKTTTKKLLCHKMGLCLKKTSKYFWCIFKKKLSYLLVVLEENHLRLRIATHRLQIHIHEGLNMTWLREAPKKWRKIIQGPPKSVGTLMI